MSIAALALAVLFAQESKATITVDYSDAPDVKEWAEKARTLCEEWYPKIAETLRSKDFQPPREVTLSFKDEKKGIAYTTGAKITVVADWIRKHPDDFGMVIHELCHVVQSYPRGVGWITEGIADYVRYFQFEPKPQPPKIGKKASYKEGYKTAATFLAWIQKEKDPTFISRMNEALRTGKYREELFQEWTKSDLETLWKDFIAAQ